MTTGFDDQTEAWIDGYKRTRDGRRTLTIQMLRELGVDVQTGAELDLVMREWGRAGRVTRNFKVGTRRRLGTVRGYGIIVSTRLSEANVGNVTKEQSSWARPVPGQL